MKAYKELFQMGALKSKVIFEAIFGSVQNL